MRKFIVLNQADMMALCLNKPVDICIDKNPGVLCTEEYYLKNVINQQDEVITKKGIMTRAEAQRYYEGVLDGFKESEKCFREENEQNMGYWIELGRVENDNYDFECSKCHHTDTRSKTVKVNYCWHCGARMFEPQESEET